MRLLLPALALLLLTPLAAAQQESHLVLTILPASHAASPGETVTLQGRATLYADPSVHAQLAGVPLHLSVARAPEWAQVLVSPADALFTPMPTMIPYSSSVTFTLTAIVAGNLTAGNHVGIIEARAITDPAPPGKAVSAHAQVPLVALGAPTCAPAIRAQSFDATLVGPSAGAPFAAALVGLAGALALALGRKRAALAILGVALLVPAGLPSAGAQQAQSLVIGAQPLPDVLENGTLTIVQAQTTLTTDFTVYANTAGIPISYAVVDAPAWAVVTPLPSDDLLQPPVTLAGSTQVVRPWSLAIALGDLPAVDGLVGTITVRATTYPDAPGKPITSMTQFPIVARSIAKPCAEEKAPAAANLTMLASATATARPAQSPLTVQTHDATLPVSHGAAIVGLALVGAAVGLVLARRKR